MRQQTNKPKNFSCGKTQINNIGHEETNKQTNQRTSHAGKTQINKIGYEETNKRTKEFLMPEKLK